MAPEVRPGQSRAGAMKHFGVLVPWANTVMEEELPRATRERTVWHFARLVPPSGETALTDEFLDGMTAAAPEALSQLAALDLQGIFFGCTSAGFMSEGLGSFDLTPHNLITALEAIVRRLNAIHATRVALLTPYTARITDAEVAAFNGCGIEVVTSASLGEMDNFDLIKPERLVRAADHLDTARSFDAVVISCTNLHTDAAREQLADAFGVPVLSSNSAMVEISEQIGSEYNSG